MIFLIECNLKLKNALYFTFQVLVKLKSHLRSKTLELYSYFLLYLVYWI
jgi:hypothetical protein